MNIVKSLLCAGVFAAFTTSAIATEEKDIKTFDIKTFAQELKKHLKAIPSDPDDNCIEKLNSRSKIYKFFDENFEDLKNDNIKLKTPDNKEFNWKEAIEKSTNEELKGFLKKTTHKKILFYKELKKVLDKNLKTDLTEDNLIKFYLKINKNEKKEQFKNISDDKVESTIKNIEKELLDQIDNIRLFLEHLNVASEGFIEDVDFKKMFEERKLPKREPFQKAFNEAVSKAVSKKVKNQLYDQDTISIKKHNQKVDELKNYYDKLIDEETKKLKSEITRLEGELAKKSSPTGSGQTSQQQTQQTQPQMKGKFGKKKG